MAQIVPCYFAPDIDNAWSVAPGALTSIDAFAPMQNGAYGSMGTANLFSSSTLTGADILWAKLFRQVNGSVRLLCFRKQNIDEYDSSAVRTNQGTGYSASTADWDAAAWGNQIIACNYLDATQSSTGTTFGALGGSSPKARYVAANLNFVMLADVDDGGSNVFSDMVWWCGLRNPATWTPAIATQAGNIRLLDAPGPIRGLVSYRDSFIAFKDNAIFVGEYIGPPYLFSWRLVSSRVGCIAPKSVAELDGRLYFLHSSGFYEFDGSNLRNIGLPVFQSFLSEGSYITFSGDREQPDATITSADAISLVQAAVDDLEGVVWFKTGANRSGGNGYGLWMYGYNPRSGKWGRASGGSGDTTSARFVSGSSTDAQAFKADKTGRVWMVYNLSTGTTLRSIRYPVANDAGSTLASSQFTTGVFGSVDGSDMINTIYWRTLNGTTVAPTTVTVTGYTSENKRITNGSNSGSVNSEFEQGDARLDSRFRTATVGAWASGPIILAGVGFDGKPSGKR